MPETAHQSTYPGDSSPGHEGLKIIANTISNRQFSLLLGAVSHSINQKIE
jgi:hypothetical protein